MKYKSLYASVRRHHASFASPEDLWSAAVAYFEWCDENPLIEEKFTAAGPVMVDMSRPYTHQGFIAHSGISRSGWNKYRNNPAFAEVVDLIENVMYEQKFAGAACGLMNASLITRDLGLSDKQDVKTDHTSSDGSMTPKAPSFTFKGVGEDSE